MEQKKVEIARRRVEIASYLADLQSLKTRMVAGMAGALGGFLAQIPIHEFGHWLAAKAYGNDTQFYFLGDRITQQIIYVGDVSPVERGIIAMGGPIADYVSAFTALMFSRRAGKDSNLKPAAALYALTVANQPMLYALTDLGRDFSVLSDVGVPKPVQVGATLALSVPLMYLSLREFYRSIGPVAKRIRNFSMKRRV